MSVGKILWDSPLGLFVRIPAKMHAYRELLWNLTLKELRIRYKQSFLGIAWAIFIPVATTVLFTVVFKTVAKIPLPVVPETGKEVEYVIFAYVGILPWNFFSQGLTGCVATLVTNRQLVTKLYFPREVFPLSKILSLLLDLAIGAIVVIVLMIYFDTPARWTLLFIPVLLLIQLMFMVGCGLILSMANLFYRDVQYVFHVGIQLWMFATAVVYPLPAEKFGPVLGWVLRLNPMTPIIEGYRAAIIEGRVPDFAEAIPALVVVGLTFWIGMWAFDRAQYLFAERV